MLCESFFYLASVFKQTRDLFKKLRSVIVQSLLLWLSALVPYLIFSLSANVFNRNCFYLLAGLTLIFSFWYAVVPRRVAYDIGFLVLAAAPQITGVFKRFYVIRQMDVLGHTMWIHVGIFALLVLRDWKSGEFSFWPQPREWQIGSVVFVAAIAPLIGLSQAVHFAHFAAPTAVWWRVFAEGVAVFFGSLWVVALSEELFFRGFIQNALEKQWGTVSAILSASLLFGIAHLWTYGFPNWRYAIVTVLLGIACGIAYWWSGSVRGSMVTHALVVVTWRLFFQLRGF